jgi:hypothetical protein
MNVTNLVLLEFWTVVQSRHFCLQLLNPVVNVYDDRIRITLYCSFSKQTFNLAHDHRREVLKMRRSSFQELLSLRIVAGSSYMIIIMNSCPEVS